MNRDELCSIETIFVEDENYVLSRYEEKELVLTYDKENKKPVIRSSVGVGRD